MKGVTASVPVPEVHRDVLVAVLVYGWMPAIAISPDLPAECRHVDVLLGEPTHPGRKEVAGGVLLSVPAAPWVVVGSWLQAYPRMRCTEVLRSNHILRGQKEVLRASSHQLLERGCHEARCWLVQSRTSGVQVPLADLFDNQYCFVHLLPFFRVIGE